MRTDQGRPDPEVLPGLSEGPFGSMAQYQRYASTVPNVANFPSRWVDQSDPIAESPMISQLKAHCGKCLVHPSEFPFQDVPYDAAVIAKELGDHEVEQDLLFFLSLPNTPGSLGFGPVFTYHVITRLGILTIQDFFEYLESLPDSGDQHQNRRVAKALVEAFEPQLSLRYASALAKLGLLKVYVEDADLFPERQGEPYRWRNFRTTHFLRTNRHRITTLHSEVTAAAQQAATKAYENT